MMERGRERSPWRPAGYLFQDPTLARSDGRRRIGGAFPPGVVAQHAAVSIDGGLAVAIHATVSERLGLVALAGDPLQQLG